MSHAPKLARLEEILTGCSSALVAFSGGLDSRFLVDACRRAGIEFQAVHFTGPHVTAAESAAASAWLTEQGISFHLMRMDLLADEAIRRNSVERCYHCKRRLFLEARKLADDLSLKHVLEGSQTSDLKAYRPGKTALIELDVKSPLAEAGLTKPDIRTIARDLGLAGPEQPARPCLLTRFDYGLPADGPMLARLAAIEDELWRLGLKDFRLRIVSGANSLTQYYILQVAAVEREHFNACRRQIFAVLFRDGFHPVELVFSDKISGFFDHRQGLLK